MIYDAVRLNRSDAAMIRVVSPVIASDQGDARRRAARHGVRPGAVPTLGEVLTVLTSTGVTVLRKIRWPAAAAMLLAWLIRMDADLVRTQSLISALPIAARAPLDNPTTPEKVELGRLLFWDPILSGTKDVACATCHHPRFGYSENRDISIGAGGIGLGADRRFPPGNSFPFVKRNSQTVLNAAFNGIDAVWPPRPGDGPDVLGCPSSESRVAGARADQDPRGNAWGRLPCRPGPPGSRGEARGDRRVPPAIYQRIRRKLPHDFCQSRPGARELPAHGARQ